MAMPKRLDKCPISPECVHRKLVQDPDTGKLYQIDKSGNFVTHVCTSKGTHSNKPEVAYMGEWLNEETKRTRWIGPERMRKSAEKAPYDERYRKRGSKYTPWKLVATYITKFNWEKIEDDPTSK